jgi:hypothetical protein
VNGLPIRSGRHQRQSVQERASRGRHDGRADHRLRRGRDHDRDPLPFHLPRANHTISLGFFSRLREINPESSFSVLG